MDKKPKVLFYGYGNPGRQDDALGILFVEELEAWTKKERLENIFFDSNYQLNIEDADEISDFDIVFFVDATLESIDNFSVTEVQDSEAQVEFTMHAISPGVVLNLCRQIYPSAPTVYLISIRGYKWDLDFDKGISDKARENLDQALEFVRKNWRRVTQSEEPSGNIPN